MEQQLVRLESELVMLGQVIDFSNFIQWMTSHGRAEFLAFPAGVIIAALASAVGIGGGILWMPFFIIFLKLSPETAVVTSLLVQTAGMGSGSAFI
jgi:hypothetical protein